MSSAFSIRSILYVLPIALLGCEAQTGKFASDESRIAREGAGEEDTSVKRRIIYTGHLTVQIQDFDAAQSSLLKLVEKQKGYVTTAEIIGQTGESRTGQWTVRVPVDDFQSFVDSASDLGVQESFRTESQDVTEEYVDLEARIKNKQIQEERLNEMMKKAEGKIEELLKLEQEITRVRGEIEQMQGRRKYLSRLTELATIHVTFREVKEYQPATAPGFGSQIATAFDDSLGGLAKFGKVIVLVLVALVPWLPVILIVGGGVWFVIRRSSRKTPTSVRT